MPRNLETIIGERLRIVSSCWLLFSTGSMCALAQTSELGPFIDSRVEVSRTGVTLALRDLSGDGHLELIEVDHTGLVVHALDEAGAYSDPAPRRPWTTPSAAWDLADLDGDGRTELLLLEDSQHLFSYAWKGGKWSDAEELVESPIYLPAGRSRVPFARDVDGDGRQDLVLTGPGRFQIYLNRGVVEGAGSRLAWAPPLAVEYDPDVQYDLGDPNRLSSTFGQSVRIPYFAIQDVDGDGRQDLISELEDRVSVHLARPEIDAIPTWELDLSAGKQSPALKDIDLDDLLSSVSGFTQWMIADMDGSPPNDLVIGAEGEVRLYLGGGATGTARKPTQVLKSSGNILRFFVRQVVGDNKPDLQLIRGERVSLSKLLKYLVLPGQLDFDVLTYKNSSGMLARRPTQRSTIALRVPRLLSFFSKAKELGERLEQEWKIPAKRLDWDQDGNANDIVDEVDGELVIYIDAAPPVHKFENLTMEQGIDGLVEQILLSDTDRLGAEEVTVIDLGSFDQFASSPGAALRAAVGGRKPDVRMPLWPGTDDRVFRSVDLNGDGKTDILTVIEFQQSYRIQLLVQR